MTGISPEAARQLEILDEQMADVQRRAETAARLSAEVDAMRGAGSSAGREVRVEVDSLGRLTALSFTAEAYNLSPNDLADVVLDTVATAREQLGRDVMGKVEAAFGAESETAAALRATYLPPSPPEPEEGTGRGPSPGQGPMLYTRR